MPRWVNTIPELWGKQAIWIAGIMCLVNTFCALAADDLPKGAFRITQDELIWKPRRVPGHAFDLID
jgi:hypothetical protein